MNTLHTTPSAEAYESEHAAIQRARSLANAICHCGSFDVNMSRYHELKTIVDYHEVRKAVARAASMLIIRALNAKEEAKIDAKESTEIIEILYDDIRSCGDKKAFALHRVYAAFYVSRMYIDACIMHDAIKIAVEIQNMKSIVCTKAKYVHIWHMKILHLLFANLSIQCKYANIAMLYDVVKETTRFYGEKGFIHEFIPYITYTDCTKNLKKRYVAAKRLISSYTKRASCHHSHDWFFHYYRADRFFKELREFCFQIENNKSL
jgi:hypothetical protein